MTLRTVPGFPLVSQGNSATTLVPSKSCLGFLFLCMSLWPSEGRELWKHCQILANKNIGLSVKFEFHVNIEKCFIVSMTSCHIWDILILKSYVVHLKFTYNWLSCVLPGKPLILKKSILKLAQLEPWLQRLDREMLRERSSGHTEWVLRMGNLGQPLDLTFPPR